MFRCVGWDWTAVWEEVDFLVHGWAMITIRMNVAGV
jgi:hypothetical protein